MGYIIASIASGSLSGDYVVLGTLIAILPDFDIILIPLGKRLPIFGHRGITHTLVFVIFSSTLIYLLYSLISGYWDIKMLFILLMCGLSHILGDFLTSSGIPLLYPWIKRYSKLNLDISINPIVFLTVLTFLFFLNFINLESIPSSTIQRLVYALAVVYFLYFSLRATLKYYYSQKPQNKSFVAIPTWNPFSWRFASRFETPEEIQVMLKRDEGVRVYCIPNSERQIATINDCLDLVSTYWHPKVQDYLHLFEFPYYELDCRGEKKEIYWRAAEVGDLVSIKVVWQDDRIILRTQGEITLPFSGGRHLHFYLPG
ncbi:MAG: metal-dependent hydrolase [Methanotrichaceae archaeon]|nr:metal-dependent hydrolase [Methanotrichaceae archaeon]